MSGSTHVLNVSN